MTDGVGVPAPGAVRAGPSRTRPVAVLAVLVGAGVVLLASGRPWASVPVTGVPGHSAVQANGSSVAPGAPALALVALAGAVVLATAGRWVRLMVAALLLLVGLGTAALGLPVLSSPGKAVAAAVATVTGTTGVVGAQAAGATGWPVVSGAGGLLVAAGGAIALARWRTWSGPGRRYQIPAVTVPAGTPRPTGRDEALEDWDRLSRGEDPTLPGPP